MTTKKGNVFSERLRALRLKHNLTQKQMAEYLGVDRSTYGNYENGRVPDMWKLRELAVFFNVSVDWLLGVDDDPRIKSLSFEGDWEEGAQIFRRGSQEWDERRKADIARMLKALFNNQNDRKANPPN